MRFLFSLLKKIIFALLLGLFLLFLMLPHQKRFIAWTEQKFLTGFCKSLQCRVTGRLESVSFFHPTISFVDFSVDSSTNPGWSWRCDRFTISWHWLLALFYQKLPLELAFDGLSIATEYNQSGFAIREHFQQLTKAPTFPIPLCLYRFYFQPVRFSLCHENKTTHAQLSCSGMVQLQGPVNLNFLLHKASCTYNDRELLALHDGRLSFAKSCWQYQGPLKLTCLQRPERIINCRYATDSQEGLISMDGQDEQLCIGPVTVNMRDMQLQTSVKMAMQECMRSIFNTDDWQAALSATINLHFADGSLNIHGEVGGLTYKNQTIIDHARYQADYKKNILTAKMQSITADVALDTHVTFDHVKKNGSCHIKNSNHIVLKNQLSIEPENAQMTIDLIDGAALQGGVAITIAGNKQPINLQAAINGTLQAIQVQGKSNEYTLQATGACLPRPQLHLVRVRDEAHKTLIAIDGNNNRFSSVCDLSLFKHFLPKKNKIAVDLKGALKVEGVLLENQIDAKIDVENGSIRLPHTYNFITGCAADCSLDISNRTLVVHKAHCRLHRGSLHIDRAIIAAPSQKKPWFCYLPVVLDGCMFNSNKDLFASISGALVIEKKDDQLAFIKGSLLMDRTQIKENILSAMVQKKLVNNAGLPFGNNFDMRCDLIVASKEPIRVKTPLLETSAQLKLHITNRFADPHIAGYLKLLSGAIAFPYRSLFISQGKLSFMPGSLHDPAIEFIAKNKIKHYTVTMQVMGTLKNHDIVLTSSPPLTQEQIICLLLAGSQDSLTGAVPAVLMKNMKQIFFDVEHTQSKLQSAIAQLFSPLKHIFLIPSFSDQTGRGGLRGAIEIDIGERWRGLIQKNFSLSEDTRFEIEYAVSDDIFMRAYRDERQDIGAEVEVRWKF